MLVQVGISSPIQYSIHLIGIQTEVLSAFFDGDILVGCFVEELAHAAEKGTRCRSSRLTILIFCLFNIAIFFEFLLSKKRSFVLILCVNLKNIKCAMPFCYQGFARNLSAN